MLSKNMKNKKTVYYQKRIKLIKIAKQKAQKIFKKIKKIRLFNNSRIFKINLRIKI